MIAAAQSRDQERRAPTVTLFLLVAVAAFLIFLLAVPPQLAGDSVEYISVARAWLAHGSPDMQPADSLWLETKFGVDVSAVVPLLGLADPRGGGQLGYHFWLYPLLTLPAMVLAEIIGADWLRGFQATNVALFAAAIGFALLGRRPTPARRWILVGLAAVGPVLWYMRWPHPEVFCWACVLVAVVCLDDRRYPAAAAMAALGAMQNPPLGALALYAVMCAALAGDRRRLGFTVAAASLLVVPSLYYLAVLGVPSPIVAVGWAEPKHISAARTWNLFTDPNQGLLAYVPLLLGLALLGTLRGVVRRDLRVLGIAAVVCLMIVGVQTIHQWNSGSAGLMRYAVWMLPLLAWLAAEGLPEGPWLARTAALAVVLQAAIVVAFGFGATLPRCGFPSHAGDGIADVACHLTQRPLARQVLSHWPQLYNPPADVFYCRTRETDAAISQIDRPAGFVREDGTVTKILAEARTVDRIAELFAVAPAYRAELRRAAAAEPGLFYLHPPRGTVTSFCAGQRVAPAEEFRQFVDVAVRHAPSSVDAPRFTVDVVLSNRGSMPICNRTAGGGRWFSVSYRVWEDERMLIENGLRTRAADVLQPGANADVAMQVLLPRRVGRYVVEILPVLEMVTWGARPARLAVEVVAASPDRFHATLAPSPEIAVR